MSMPSLVPELAQPVRDAMKQRAQDQLDGMQRYREKVANDLVICVNHLNATYQRLDKLRDALLACVVVDADAREQLVEVLVEHGVLTPEVKS